MASKEEFEQRDHGTTVEGNIITDLTNTSKNEKIISIWEIEMKNRREFKISKWNLGLYAAAPGIHRASKIS